jgi:hypothetical protein
VKELNPEMIFGLLISQRVTQQVLHLNSFKAMLMHKHQSPLAETVAHTFLLTEMPPAELFSLQPQVHGIPIPGQH